MSISFVKSILKPVEPEKTGIAFLIPFFFFAIISTVGVAVEKAATGAPTLPSEFIVLSPEKMNWSDAEAYCARQSGKLPRINDSAAWNGGVIFIDGFGTVGSYWPEGLPSDTYWTGTKHADFPNVAWAVAPHNYVVVLSDEQNKTYRTVCVPIDSSSAEKLSENAALETQQATPQPFPVPNQEAPPVASGSDGNALTGITYWYIKYRTAPLSISDFIELCKTGSAQQINDALKAGADVNAKFKSGSTPLMWAAQHNSNPEVTAALIKAGAGVNARDDAGETPLMWAAQLNSNPEVTAALIKAGSDVNAKDKQGRTPLMLAASDNSNPEMITALVKLGADINARDDRGETPLMYAALYSSNPDVITVLIREGADVNAKAKDGGTPLMWATLNAKMVAVGDAVSSKDSLYEYTSPLFVTVNNTDPEVITALVKAGADVNAKDERGRTPLMTAAWSANPALTAALLKLGADPKTQDNSGKKAVDYAKEDKKRMNTDVIRMLQDGIRP